MKDEKTPIINDSIDKMSIEELKEEVYRMRLVVLNGNINAYKKAIEIGKSDTLAHLKEEIEKCRVFGDETGEYLKLEEVLAIIKAEQNPGGKCH